MKKTVLPLILNNLMLAACLTMSFIQVNAQQAITGLNSVYTAASTGTTYVLSGAPTSTMTGTYTYNYGSHSGTTSNVLNITSLSIGANTYVYRNEPTAVVKIRRNNNAQVTGTRQLLWYEATSVPPLSTTINLNQPYQPNMEIMFNGAKGLNAGTDNIFCNTGDGNGNNNNIERFDYIMPLGNVIGDPSGEGFSVMDRGVLNAHDPFCVAVITGIDGSNNPTSYTSTVFRVNATHYGSINPMTSITTAVLRMDEGESNLKISTSTSPTQGVGGVFISYADLGLTAGTTVYGYSIVGNDFPVSGTGADLVNWSNTTYFPTNTEATDGGLDMIAVSGVFKASSDLAPTAEEINNPYICNVTSSGHLALGPLSAVDFNAGGSIASYTVYTLPPAAAGILYYNNGSTDVAVTAGMILTPAQAATLSFDAVDNYAGTVSFTYYATNNLGLYSNTAVFSIPMSVGPVSGFSMNDNIQDLTGNNFIFTSTTPTSGNTYSWNFGDGGTASTTIDATHTYTAMGIYTVTQIVRETVSGCVIAVPHDAIVLSDSVDGGGGGGLESESLGGLVSLRDFTKFKNGTNKPVDYSIMQPIKAANYINAKTTGSAPGSTLERLTPTSLDATTTAFETSPADLVEITKAKQAYAVDYVRNNQAKAVVLGIVTLDKVYTHTKSICDRLRGATLVKTEVKTIQGFNFIEYVLQRADAMEYCIAFDAGKSQGRNTFALQTNWLISRYTGDDSVFNFQVWAADPTNTEILVNKLLDNFRAIMPLQQIDTAFKLPAAYISSGVRNKGFLEVTVTNNSTITSAEMQFDERVCETANVGSLTFPMTLVPGKANKFNIPIRDGYEYPGNLYLNGELTDVVYMADGNWSLDYDANNTSISKYSPENEPDRIYADNEYPVYRSLAVKGHSSDYFSAYKFIASGNAKADLTKYHSVKFYAKGSGVATVTLLKKGIVNFKEQYTAAINLDSAGRDYELSFADFTSSSTKDAFKANDVTAIVYSCAYNSVPTDFEFHIRKVAFSTDEVMSYNLLHSKNATLSPNPGNGNFEYKFYSEADQQLNMIITDIAGNTVYKQPVDAKMGANAVQVSLPANVRKAATYIVSMGNQQTHYSNTKMVVVP